LRPAGRGGQVLRLPGRCRRLPAPARRGPADNVRIGGERDLTERELPQLAGWRGSRPVRVGNGAWTQRQLDVYGELLLAAQRLIDQLGELDPVTRQFLAAAADTAAARWREKDQGIWEIRGEPRTSSTPS